MLCGRGSRRKRRRCSKRESANLDAQLEKLAHRIAAAEEARSRRRGERDGVRQAIAEQGGDRIERIKQEIAETLARKDERALAGRTLRRASPGSRVFPPPPMPILSSPTGAPSRLAAAEAEAAEAQAQNALTEAGVELSRNCRSSTTSSRRNWNRCGRRLSNIPRHMLEMRAELCRAAGLREAELPFAGELLEVRQEARDWEGAIERLLHGFGLSIAGARQPLCARRGVGGPHPSQWPAGLFPRAEGRASGPCS